MNGKQLLCILENMTPEELEAPVIAGKGGEGENPEAYNINTEWLKTYTVADDDPELLALGLKVEEPYIYLKLIE